MSGFRKWLDHRTGYRRLISALLIEHIPGGAKWRYVWGSTLLFVFTVQLITGILLMTAYSPADSTAWASVYYIQYEMDFGWLIRGLHHFGSQVMVVLLGIHMLQVVIASAHLPPREVNWWLGLGLLAVVLGLSLTGYLLPWDQKGYWATQVATGIASSVPEVGPGMQKTAVGGPEYGHHTLTRFYALHVSILPGLLIILAIAHLAVFRRHGVTHPSNPQGEGWFWPDQAFRDMLVSMLIFGIMLALVIFGGHGHKLKTPDAESQGLYEKWAHAGREGRGANLDAPADRATANYPARPEWYFLALFQLLKYFKGDQAMIGTVVIPVAVGVLLFLLPLLGYGRMRKFGHAVGIIVVLGLLAAVAILTYQAMSQDAKNEEFQKDLKLAQQQGERAVQIAHEGIPAQGAGSLLRRDPYTQGPILFAAHCATCHNHSSDTPEFNIQKKDATASDLGGFGTEKWIRDLLREPDSPRFFGSVKLPNGRPRFTQMTNWVRKAQEEAKDSGNDAVKELEADLDLIANWLGSHPRGLPKEGDERFAKGYLAFRTRCNECHPFEGQGGDNLNGPDFTGYGDAEWVRLMLTSPNDPMRYGRRNLNAMPAFRDFEGPGGQIARHDFDRIKDCLLKEIADDDPQADDKKKQIEEAMRHVQLSDLDRELIIRWLLRDYRVVFGGEPIASPIKP